MNNTDREKLISWIRSTYVSNPPYTYKATVDDTADAVIADMLIANGVVVREKGEWGYTGVEDEDWGATWHKWTCSNCGYSTGQNPFGANFCPNCGADMRKETK